MDQASAAGETIDPLAISMMYEHLLLCLRPSPTRAKFLNALACYRSGALQDADINGLNWSACIYVDAVRDSAELDYEMNLAKCLGCRFDQIGDLADLNTAIQIFIRGASSTPEGHPDKPGRLHNCAKALRDRFSQTGDLNDLNKSIDFSKSTVLLSDTGHPERPVYVTILAHSLICLFEHVGDQDNLEKSIEAYNEALQLSTESDPDKPEYISNLASSLLTRFEHRGDHADLHHAIHLFGDSVALTPADHPRMSACLSNLAGSLSCRFDVFGDLDDLDRSIKAVEEAVVQTSDSHLNKFRYLHNLGNSLLCRFQRQNNPDDLNRSIKVLESSISLTPDQSVSMPSKLISLSQSLKTRFELNGDITDITRAVEFAENAVMLTPEEHSNKPAYLNTLGNSLYNRFELQGDVADLNRAIQLKEKVQLLTSNGHPQKSLFLISMGDTLMTRFEMHNDPQDLEAALSSFSSAAQSVVGPSNVRYMAARRWRRYAIRYRPEDVIKACTTAMKLIPELTWLGSSIADRHHQVREAGQVARDAAALAIEAKHYGTAVEWLEEGRSVIWTQMLQLRSPVDELRQVRPDLANKLQYLSYQLEGAGTNTSDRSNQQGVTGIDYHTLAHQRTVLLKEIREIDGFEAFMLPKGLPQLRLAANRGCVVMLNVSELRCDALILLPHHDDVMHVHLPDVNLRYALRWHECIQLALIKPTVSTTDFLERLKGIRVPDSGTTSLTREEMFTELLKELWYRIADPVLSALAGVSLMY